MTRLVVNNFLSITHCDIELKRFNIFIGPQATGKSIISKIIFLLHSIQQEHMVYGAHNNFLKKHLDRHILKKFLDIFPQYTWNGTIFSIKICYSKDKIIQIYSKKTHNGKSSLYITYSHKIINEYHKHRKFLLSIYKKEQDLVINENDTHTEMDEYNKLITKQLTDDLLKFVLQPFFRKPLFIPAARSFFANLQKNIFTIISSNIDIDPLLKNFGSSYEQAKIAYSAFNKNNHLSKDIMSLTKKILKSEYIYKDDQDWLVTNKSTINIANASSGQQESLPMLVVLSALASIKKKSQLELFIEEPEAHLFPISQNHVISLLSIILESTKINLYITTHSPYILSAINNLTTAAAVIDNDNEDDIHAILGDGKPIPINTISAYTIKNGKVSSILDTKNNLIGINIIDSVSDKIGDTYDKLLDIEFS